MSIYGFFLSIVGFVSGVTWPSYKIRFYSTIVYTIGLVIYTLIFTAVTIGGGFLFMSTGGRKTFLKFNI